MTTLTMTFLTNGYSVHYIPIDYAAPRFVKVPLVDRYAQVLAPGGSDDPLV